MIICKVYKNLKGKKGKFMYIWFKIMRFLIYKSLFYLKLFI